MKYLNIISLGFVYQVWLLLSLENGNPSSEMAFEDETSGRPQRIGFFFTSSPLFREHDHFGARSAIGLPFSGLVRPLADAQLLPENPNVRCHSANGTCQRERTTFYPSHLRTLARRLVTLVLCFLSPLSKPTCEPSEKKSSFCILRQAR